MPGVKPKILTVEVGFAIAVGIILIVLLMPLPPLVLDLLLVGNLSMSLFLLLLMFYLQSPLEFSSFPAFLLLFTLFRLSLNVASTKLILLDGFAGNIIAAFGMFVVGNNYVVGAVMFLILVIIQFVVITKGAGRIAEVTARFTLDAMPGKQMSIDADLNAGIIDEDEARGRREKLSQEADFFGAMDGASKFVRGDAVASLLITAVNIVGGLAIGVLQRGMPAHDALRIYTLMTIGDGLVAQIPALIVSIAAGILVTKAAGEQGLGSHIASQLTRRPEPFFIGGGMLGLLGLIPGLPFLPFALICAGSVTAGTMLRKHLAAQEAAVPAIAGAGRGKALPGAAKALPAAEAETAKPVSAAVAPIALEIGFALIPLVDASQEGDLVERLGKIRDQVFEEIGIMIPPIAVQDNLELSNNSYRILIRGMERARGVVYPGSHLAIDPGDVSGGLEGIRTSEPAFGFPAVWIEARRVTAAEAKGYTVVDCSSVIATHLAKVARQNAVELFSRQAVSDLLDNVKKTDSVVVNELVPQLLSIGGVHRVLQFLITEQVPIHDMANILETLADYAEHTKDPLLLSEFCRQNLRSRLVAKHLTEDARLRALILAPQVEEILQQNLASGKPGVINLNPAQAEILVQQIQDDTESRRGNADAPLVLLVAPAMRPHLARLVHRKMPELAVLSYAEVGDDVELQVLGAIAAKIGKEAIAA